MSGLSPDLSAKARKFAGLIRKRLAEQGQSAVARACGVDVATVSRWCSDGRLEQFVVMLDVLGLKVVSSELRGYREDEIEALFTLARARLGQLRNASDLAEGDE